MFFGTNEIAMTQKPLPPWEDVLSAACRLQRILPDAVLLGGTAASLYAKHRRSRDADHALTDLKSRFDEVLAQLESVAGWKTARINKPVLILGSLDGIETGIRQLKRKQPLETEVISTEAGDLRVPTLNEILRVKGWLVVTRNATRDYVDFAALSSAMDDERAWSALEPMDALYPQPIGESPLAQLSKQLSNPRPFDLDKTNLTEYKGLAERWHKWSSIVGEAERIAGLIIDNLQSTPKP
jgi:hypothetical protein